MLNIGRSDREGTHLRSELFMLAGLYSRVVDPLSRMKKALGLTLKTSKFQHAHIHMSHIYDIHIYVCIWDLWDLLLE